MNKTNPRQAEFFLKSLYEGKPEDDFICLFFLPSKTSVGYKTPEEVHKWIVDNEPHEHDDVYLQIGTTARACRAKEFDVIGIPGVWADIDFGANHKKKNVPRDLRATMRAMDSVNVKPSMTVRSGHGLHAYWKFTEFFSIRNDTDRRLAKNMLHSWHNVLKVAFSRRGFAIDATFDLPRLLRLPGTYNHKGGRRTKVEWDCEVAATYDSKDFYNADPHKFIIDFADTDPSTPKEYKQVDSTEKKITADDFVLNPEAQPLMSKFEALCEAEPKFLKSYNRTRPETAFSDQSPSAYDMSLATIAFNSGWAIQEVVDLLIYSRKRNGDELKLRSDYYARTLNRASSGEDEIVNAVMAKTEVEEPADAIKNLNLKLNVIGEQMITRIERYIGDPDSYRIFSGDVSKFISSTESLLSRPRMENALFDIGVDCASPKWTPARRLALRKALRAAFTDIEKCDTGRDAEVFTAICELVDESSTASDSKEEAPMIISKRPYIANVDGVDHYVLFSSSVHLLAVANGSRYSKEDVVIELKRFGWFSQGRKLVVTGKKTKNRGVFMTPVDDWDEIERMAQEKKDADTNTDTSRSGVEDDRAAGNREDDIPESST